MNFNPTTPDIQAAQKALKPWCASCALVQKDQILGSFETLPAIDQRIELCFLEKQLEALRADYETKARVYLKETVTEPEPGEAADTACSVDALAEKMRKQGVGIGKNQLYCWLRESGYLRYENTRRYEHLPTRQSIEANYIDIQKVPYYSERWHKTVYDRKIQVTGLGQRFFTEKLMAERGVSPKAAQA